MSDWSEELDLKWSVLINHALLFPRSAIILGGPASIMHWSDHRYSQFNKRCIDMCFDAGVFAFDGGEYFGRIEKSFDGRHWASLDENREVLIELVKEVLYLLLSITSMPEPWKIQQEHQGFAFLMVAPTSFDDFEGEVTIPPQEEASMG